MILTHLFLQRLQYFQAQIPCGLIFRKIEQDNCLIQHNDKAQFSTFIGKKAGKFTIFLRDTKIYVYRRIYVECDDEYWARYDHIWS